MSNTSCYRRTHAKSYPVSLRYFQNPKDSLVFTSTPAITKSKLHIASNFSNVPETSLLSTGILADRTNFNNTQSKPKKRVKLNCINPLIDHSTMRKPLKSPKTYKLLQTGTTDRLGLTSRVHPSHGNITFKDEDSLGRTFQAPKLGKENVFKKISSRKMNGNIEKPRNSLWNKGAMSTRITETTILGLSPGSNILDLTSIGLGSIDDLLATDQSMLCHNVDRVEDFNRKLRSIFKGEKLDASQNVEFEISIAEEKSDFKLKVFQTKPLIRQLKN